jgi:hypothetical protein
MDTLDLVDEYSVAASGELNLGVHDTQGMGKVHGPNDAIHRCGGHLGDPR